MPPYVTRSWRVEADQLTRDHVPEGVVLARIYPEAPDPVYFVEIPRYPRPKRVQVLLGHWVVREGHEVKVMDDATFHLLYEPLVEVEEPQSEDGYLNEYGEKG